MVGLVSVCAITAGSLPSAAPVTPPVTFVTVQVKVALGSVLSNTTLVVPPVQIVSATAPSGGLAKMTTVWVSVYKQPERSS